jgi:DMSO/TMAO reductase YedYZ heme-binding membrane subunit
MTLLICILVTLPLVFLLNKPIKRYANNFYLGSIIIGLILMILPKLDFVRFPVVNQRYIGLALLSIVMFTGVLNRQNNFAKTLFSIRGELAIMGFIFVSFHAIKHILNDETYPLVWVFGLLTYLVLIPLTLTSSIKVRKWIGPKLWKRIHRLSYVFYFFVFVHLYLAANPMNQIIYMSIFALYTVLKMVTSLVKKPRRKERLASTIQ